MSAAPREWPDLIMLHRYTAGDWTECPDGQVEDLCHKSKELIHEAFVSVADADRAVEEARISERASVDERNQDDNGLPKRIGSGCRSGDGMSAAHTPGPWFVGKRQVEDNRLTITAEPGNPSIEIALVSPKPFYADNQESNASLIASAPALLAALEEILEQYEIGCSNRSGDCGTTEEEEMGAIARAALAGLEEK